VRVDTGVVEGSEISMFYDPMIAKLVTHAPTRAQAIEAQIAALDAYYIRGIGHNIDFLSAVMQHPRFQSGNITTGFIAEEYPDGFHGAPASAELTDKIVVAASVMNAIVRARDQLIDNQLNGHGANYGTDWVVVLDKQEHAVCVENLGHVWQVTHNDTTSSLQTDWHTGDPVLAADINGTAFVFEIDSAPLGHRMSIKGASHHVVVHTPRAAALARHMIEKTPPDLSRVLLCPMPGLVVSIDVAEGDKVEAGQPLAVVEAMKMQNILRAEKQSTVGKILVKAGESLVVDAVIMEFIQG
jgi:propionyl-CoA carboxylase alpha chain